MAKHKSLIALIFVLIFALSLFAGCSGGPEDEPGGPVDEIEKAERPTVDGVPYGEGRTLTISLYGNQPTGLDAVIEEYYKRTEDIFAFDIQFEFLPLEDYKSRLTLGMSSSTTNYDLVFDAQWIYLQEWSKNGNYIRLDKYFDNDEYPGLKKAFSGEYLGNNKFNEGIYGIPLTESFGSTVVAYYREDWRKEAAKEPAYSDLSDGINSAQDMELFFRWVKDNKTSANTWPLLVNKSALGPGSLAADFYDTGDGFTLAQKNEMGVRTDWQIAANLNLAAYVDPETKIVKGVYAPQMESTASLSFFPAQFQTESAFTGNWQSNYEKIRDWYEAGYISPDAINENDATLKFRNGQGGVYVDDIVNFPLHKQALLKNDASAELEIYVPSKAEREYEKGYYGTDFKAWNFLCIPKNSKNEDLAMLFMDWLFDSRENHDLFQYGVEGVHWSKIDPQDGNGTYYYEVTPEHEAYTFNPYLLTWNPTYLRTPVGLTDKALRHLEYIQDESSFTPYLYAGFTFDTTTVSTELANANFATYKNQSIPYELGSIEDPVTRWNQLISQRISNQKFQTDLSIIKAEFMNQLQAYIDSQE